MSSILNLRKWIIELRKKDVCVCSFFSSMIILIIIHCHLSVLYFYLPLLSIYRIQYLMNVQWINFEMHLCFGFGTRKGWSAFEYILIDPFAVTYLCLLNYKFIIENHIYWFYTPIHIVSKFFELIHNWLMNFAIINNIKYRDMIFIRYT